MLQKDEKDCLYLVWKSGKSGKQYIVGQLIKNRLFKFRYSEDVKHAIDDGFSPLLCFQDLNREYANEKLFPVFACRLPDKRRRDIQKILDKYGMEEYDEYILLRKSGARLPIDNLEFVSPL